MSYFSLRRITSENDCSFSDTSVGIIAGLLIKYKAFSNSYLTVYVSKIIQALKLSQIIKLPSINCFSPEF